MKDEEFVFRADSREKAITARSAKHTRTHCGKGGRVRLPSDNLSKRELKKMNGECKAYRLNEPMKWQEFKAMPDDIKVTYIKLLQQKFNVPFVHIGKMLGVTQKTISAEIIRLGLSEGKAAKGRRKKWDKEGFYAWWHGVDQLPTPVPEKLTVTQEDIDDIEQAMPGLKLDPIDEPCVEDDLPDEEPDSNIDALPIQFDDYLKVVEELKAVHEKDKAETEWLRNECDNLRIHARILEAQMEVVRLIFGGKNNG